MNRSCNIKNTPDTEVIIAKKDPNGKKIHLKSQIFLN